MRLATLAALLLSVCAVATAFHGVQKRFNGQPNRCLMGHSLNRRAGSGAYMTQPACRNICARTVSSYFGLTKGNTCLCDDRVSPNAFEVDGRQCMYRCSGNPQEACGGRSTTLVFHVSRYIPIAAPMNGGLRRAAATQVTCILSHENEGLALSEMVTIDEHMTVGYCHTLCDRGGYRFFGLTRGDSCYCDNYMHRSMVAQSSKCKHQCKGSSKEYCGGLEAMFVYRLKYE